ncbi:MAG: LPS-assembly protein LptD [Pseudomonadota bacterium]
MTRHPRHSLPRAFGAAGLALATAAHADDAPGRPDFGLCRSEAAIDGYLAGLPIDGDRATAPTEITARELTALRAGEYELTGDAEARRADQRLAAGRLRYASRTQTAQAEGDVRYQDRGLLVAAARADADLGRDATTLQAARYQLLGTRSDGTPSRGNGSAAKARIEGGDGKQVTYLEDVTFSTCDPDNRDWEITAREMTLDQATGGGAARGMRLRFKDTTLLALPYASFPIDDRRRSGFLLPSTRGGSTGGFDLALPYYLNLAPDYDATLTPRVVSDRGFMAGGEFRWLGERQRGVASATWMPDDREADRSRFSYSLRHSASLNPNFFVVSDLNRVSDPRYFEDFGDGLTAAATSLLPSSAYLHGRAAWWNLSFGGDDIEVTDPRIGAAAEPYRRLPRFTLDVDYPLGEYLRVGVRGEAVSFDKDDDLDDTGARVDVVTGRRYDVTPYVAFPFERAFGYLRPEFAFRETRYALDGAREDSPSRGTPVTSVDAGLFFDRPARLFGTDLRQTLEPRLFYLRVPYRDQDDLPLFDTQELTFSFAQLFRLNRFTGPDRQVDANQATLALTTRLLDDAAGNEWLRLSFGQLRYFDDQRVQLPGIAPTDFDGSDYAAELDFGPSDRWRFIWSQLYDPDRDRTDLSAFRVQHRFGERGVANLAYRFRRDLLEQVDASTAFPLSERTRLVARWNWSLRDRRTLEALAGLEFGDCCYAFRILGRHYVRNVEGDTANAIFLELELKGLGSLGRRSEDFLRRAILGYR